MKITRRFSSFEENAKDGGWVELLYDCAIRVAVSPGSRVVALAADSLLGEPAEGSLRLQGTGITSLSCPNPDCVRGVPPFRDADDAVFWMELTATACIEGMDDGTPRLIVPGSSAPIEVPIFDEAIGAGQGLRDALRKFFESKALAEDVFERVAFHVYLITGAEGPLAALQNKRIALPIPCELVMAAVCPERIRFTG